MTEQNNFGQYIGSHLDDDVTLSLPDLRQLPGRYCTLQLLSTRHGNDLFQGWHSIEDSRDWTYLPDERPPTKQATHSYIQQLIQQKGVYHYAIIENNSGKAVGTLSLYNLDNKNGVAEIGSVHLTPVIKRTSVSTEAIFLILSYVFDVLKYRRCEWQTDRLNSQGMRSAERLGFQKEGVLRNKQILKSRSVDVVMYSIIQDEWERISSAITIWLRTVNFDDRGHQIHPLRHYLATTEP